MRLAEILKNLIIVRPHVVEFLVISLTPDERQDHVVGDVRASHSHFLHLRT